MEGWYAEATLRDRGRDRLGIALTIGTILGWTFLAVDGWANDRVPPKASESTAERAFSDELVRLIIEDKRPDIRRAMEARFRAVVSEAQMNPLLDQLYKNHGGRPLEVEFKSEEAGSKAYSDGVSKSLRRFWYAARTTEQPKGRFFLVVEVVTDDGALASSGFSIVTFPSGVPEALK